MMQKQPNVVLLPSIFVGSTSVNVECQIRAGARMSLGNNATPKGKISKFMISVQNIPLALAASLQPNTDCRLNPFQSITFANVPEVKFSLLF